ncbi:uncharacterized protein BXZ73DRAFT_99124 [Epithele typhae]|uniref:uncharacterized protein n=1 Tax=Epithele typhae TaxID=378194 RepID=UPI002007742C|nr:uncharacterized protein BXZ73DRAFT_99124 [Epithele typhae]KAH9940126.1 hypothetical protein BXZ73DRAFT_99124 [Epithele typhae]
MTSPVTSPISTLDGTVLQIVRTLNFEISEAAAPRVTNTFRVAENPEPLKVAAAFERAREAVGPVIAELLESIHHREDPIPIYIFQPPSQSVFAGAYRELWRSESQRAVAEWRPRARKQLAERVADGELLTLAPSDAVPRPPALYAAHAGHVDAVVRAALDLQRLAAEYELHVMRIDEAFDGARIEDIYHGEIGTAGPPGKVPVGDPTCAEEDRDRVGKLFLEVLAKVVLGYLEVVEVPSGTEPVCMHDDDALDSDLDEDGIVFVTGDPHHLDQSIREEMTLREPHLCVGVPQLPLLAACLICVGDGGGGLVCVRVERGDEADEVAVGDVVRPVEGRFSGMEIGGACFQSSYIKFGSLSCNDPKVKIRRGQLTLPGDIMLRFFLPALDSIVAVIRKQGQEASRPLATVFLVGGFAANPWLHSALKDRLEALNTMLCRPDSHTDKAVANGAVCYFLEHVVSARVMKMTFGTGYAPAYSPQNPEHLARRAKTFTDIAGCLRIPGGFSSILTQGTRVHETKEFSKSYSLIKRDTRNLDAISEQLSCYRGPISDVRWEDVDRELFTPLCTIHADTSKVVRRPVHGPKGVYYVLDFDIVLLCGPTELQAQIRWREDGKERRGPAQIVHNE